MSLFGGDDGGARRNNVIVSAADSYHSTAPATNTTGKAKQRSVNLPEISVCATCGRDEVEKMIQPAQVQKIFRAMGCWSFGAAAASRVTSCYEYEV